MRRLNILSICTEFGSEVQAFKDRGHNVTTLGIVGDVEIKNDIRDVHFYHANGYFDFISAHPPCTEFSKANWRLGKCKDRKPDMSIVEACFRIVKQCNPNYWLIENPQGCLRHFIGRPQYCIRYGDYGHYCQKPTDLWGVLPWFGSYQKNNVPLGVHNKTAYSDGPRQADLRAMVPYELSMVLCKAIEEVIL